VLAVPGGRSEGEFNFLNFKLQYSLSENWLLNDINVLSQCSFVVRFHAADAACSAALLCGLIYTRVKWCCNVAVQFIAPIAVSVHALQQHATVLISSVACTPAAATKRTNTLTRTHSVHISTVHTHTYCCYCSKSCGAR
jgi:hypothetical protein